MSSETFSPPKNPLSQRESLSSSRSKSFLRTATTAGGVGKRGVRGGKTEGVKVFCLVIECNGCGEWQNLVYGGKGTGYEFCHPDIKELFNSGAEELRPPLWHRCVNCGELQPTIGYQAVDWGSELRFTPAELRELSKLSRRV